MSKIEIIPVEYANAEMAEEAFFVGGSHEKKLPIVFMIYLLRNGERNILVDAGCVTMPGWDMKNFIGPIKALAKLGVSADDITDVVITHAHHDHIECVNEFKNAEIYIQKKEYDSGKGYFADGQHIHTFDDVCDVCDGVKAVRISGHSAGSCIVEVMSDGEKTTVIAGDEVYGKMCLERNVRTGTSCSPENSEAFLKKYNNENYNILLCHEK